MGVSARLLKQDLLIHVDYGLSFGDIVVRYRGPISDPEALPEQVIHLLRARIPRDVQFELDELYQSFTLKIPSPTGPARVGWVIQPALATVDGAGGPTVRMVICRGFDAVAGSLVFYTDRESAKGVALERTPRAAVVFHWEVFERQIRVEGPVTHVSEADSDRYWGTRPLDARLAAVASAQSRPIGSRAAFLAPTAAPPPAPRARGPPP